jgi:hypothetical protein
MRHSSSWADWWQCPTGCAKAGIAVSLPRATGVLGRLGMMRWVMRSKIGEGMFDEQLRRRIFISR